MAYDFTRQALYNPETRPVFLAADKVGPFQPSADRLSMVNAWWLANAS